MAPKLVVEIIGDSSKLERSFARSSRATGQFGKNIERAGRGATVATVGFRGLGRSIAFASGAFIGAAGFTAAVKGSISSFTQFQESMQQAVGLAGVAQDKIGSFSKQILALAPVVGKTPQELAKAFYFVASSGIAASKAMDVVAASAKASAAGLGETQVVADAITSAMNAYGPAVLNATQATDVLVATVREGKGEADAFAGTIGNVAALASQLGVSFNDVGAALASMTRLGTDAETASTQLQQVFATLVKVTPQSAKAFKSVGLNADELRQQLGSKGLLFVLDEVRKAFAGNVPALAEAFGERRAIRGVLALVGKQAEQVRGVFERMGAAAGSLDSAFQAISKTTAQRFRQFQASIETLKIAVGSILAPLAGQVASVMAKAANSVTDFFEKLQRQRTTAAKIRFVLNIGQDVARSLQQVDWRAIGAEVSSKLAESLSAVAAFLRAADWSKIGGAIVNGIINFLKGVNWIALARGIVRLQVASFIASAKLLFGAGKALAKAVLDGIKAGARIALLYVSKWALQLVAKIVGAFGFLGRFDPLKGVEERVKRRIANIQRALDDLHRATVKAGAIEHARSFALPEETSPKLKRRKTSPQAAQTIADTTQVATAADKAAKAFDKLGDRLQLAFEKAQLTKPLQDDLRALRAIEAALKRRIALTKDNLDLQHQLVSTESQIRDIEQQIAQQQADARKSRQFKALGLTATGEQIVPSTSALRKRLGSVAKSVKGTVLDTKKTRTELRRIAKVLSGAFGKVGRDVRSAILQMLNDISSALQGGTKTGPLTKTKSLNTKKLLEGLGLSPEEIRAIRARLSHFNTGGRGLAAAAAAPTGGGFGGSPIVVESNVVVQLDGEKVGRAVTRSQQKASRRNPRQKRGPNRHKN